MRFRAYSLIPVAYFVNMLNPIFVTNFQNLKKDIQNFFMGVLVKKKANSTRFEAMLRYQNILPNIQSGFFIALIALPLSLGIASASSAPPVAGLITAMVAGLIASHIGGCRISIKGPAAGLIVIVMGTIVELSHGGDLFQGYRKALAVFALAGLCQILFAVFKGARIGKLMPPSVIHGMLAAIGVIIMAKQIHILLGAIPEGKTPFRLIAEIPNSIMHANPELLGLGIITMLCMILLPKIKGGIIKLLPPALWALLIVIPLSILWHLHDAHSYTLFGYDFQVGPKFLVNIPDSLWQSLVWPDFSALKEAVAYKYVAMLALVGSLESVLTVIAVDAITKNQEGSDLDRDLLAIGIGNTVAAMLGGLPMISEVVRSKANIDSKATNQWSNFFHGLFLLVALLFLGSILREIPLSTLAAMLVLVGVRLAAPSQIKHVKQIGVDQLLMFMTTLLVTLAQDLLVGVIAGLLVKLILHLIRGVKLSELFNLNAKIVNADHYTIAVSGPAIFTNSLKFQKILNEAITTNKKIIVDFSAATLVDHTTWIILNTTKEKLSADSLEVRGIGRLKPVSPHHMATHKAL